MNTEKNFLRNFLDGHRSEFFIPVYQRNYDWKREQCQQLWDDLEMLVNGTRNIHFFGCIVSYFDQTQPNIDRFILIDGQQRVTTISLLYLALSRILADTNPDIAKEIREIYLSLRTSTKLKLKLVKSDNEIFEALYNGNINEIKKASRLLDNYKFFEKKLRSIPNPLDIYNAIGRLEIVHIKLEHNDDPQLIFESLNSTGLALTEADKIRNYVLMGLGEQKQNYYYENYWSKIEKDTDFDVSAFIKDYLTLITGAFQKERDIYLSFKKYFIANNKKNNIQSFFEELKKYSCYYGAIIHCNEFSRDINDRLKNLKRLELTLVYPYLLSLFSLLDQEKISKEICADVLETLESYLFRRSICELPTNGLSKLFIALPRNIKKQVSDDYSNYLEVFRKILSASINTSSRYPNDDEFINKLKERNIYEMRSKTRNFLFDNLENFGNSEKTNLEESTLSIEHIMPQTLTPSWEKELGDNFKVVHSENLHRLGNLTYTGYNSSYGNKSFTEKKNTANGFNDSRLFLNKFVKEQAKWTKSEIDARADILAKRASNIWAYFGIEHDEEIYRDITLYDEDFDASGYKPEFFILKNEKHIVKSWKDFYRDLLKVLYDDYASDILAILTYEPLKNCVADELEKIPGQGKYSEKILPDLEIYFYMNFSANSFLKRTRHIFEALKLDFQELVIRISKD